MERSVKISGKDYTYNTQWTGQFLFGPIIALDTETTVVELPDKPEFVLASVSNGVAHYLLDPKNLADFLDMHSDKHFAFQNISFDFWVIDRLLLSQNRLKTREAWWNMVEARRAHDTMILDMLYRLAQDDSYPNMRPLDVLAKFYCRLEIDKSDPYRMRYGEILNVPFGDVDTGFLDYAIKDTIVTYFLFTHLYKKCKLMALRAGISKKCIEDYGPLTEDIQIKGALALYNSTANGFSIDQKYCETLYEKLLEHIQECTANLLSDPIYEPLFKRHVKTNELLFTENHAPRIYLKILRQILISEAERLAADGIKVIVPKTEKGNIGTSMKDWEDYEEQSMFIKMFKSLKENCKLIEFFKRVHKSKVFPRYTIMVRTGRISSYDPNCFDENTDLLTDQGWKNIKEIYGKNDIEIGQWNIDTESISFIKPLEWYKKTTNEWITLKNEHIDLKLTPDHRCILLNRKKGYYKEFSAENYPEDYKQINAASYNINKPDYDKLSDDELKLIIAIQADGHVSEYGIDFIFSKQRKIDRLNEIIDNLVLRTRIGPKPPNCTRFYIYKCEETERLLTFIPGKEKSFGPWILNLSDRQLKVFSDEIKYWDGVLRGDFYSSKFKNNADWVQIVNILSNIRTNVNIFKVDDREYYGTQITKARNYSITTNIEKYRLYTEKEEDCYCLDVSDSYIIVRRNGKVSIIGNCTNLPKKEGIREIFQAAEGCLLLYCDYSFIELRTLAAVLEQMYEKSVMADIIRTGRDLHCSTAALLTGMTYDEFMDKKKTDEEFYEKWRQWAKITSFGLPGGLSAPSLVNYAKMVYKTVLPLEQSQVLRNTWINEAYPEMARYLTEDTVQILAQNLGVPVGTVWSVFDWNNSKHPGMLSPIKNIVQGGVTKKDGGKYTQYFTDKVWENLRNLCQNETLNKTISAREASMELYKNLFWTKSHTTTGRIRGKVSFSQNKNTPFQGLAADGAKLACWKLTVKGYKLVAFVHDEIVLEVPHTVCGGVPMEVVEDVLTTMCEEMQRLTGNVPIKADFTVNKKWKKKAKTIVKNNIAYPAS